MDAAAETDALRRAIREAIASTPGMAAEAPSRVDTLVDEVQPFVDAAAATRADAGLSPEARSLAWLLGYRIGTEGAPALAASAALRAWRDASGLAHAPRLADDALPLAMDGYARAREDNARAEVQRALGESLLVTELAPGVALVVAAGPLDADGARALADRAGQFMLRRESRALLLDLSGVREPDAAVASELWGAVSSARMLGVDAVVIGEGDALREALEGASVAPGEARRVPTLARAVELLAREGALSTGAAGAWFARLQQALAGAGAALRRR